MRSRCVLPYLEIWLFVIVFAVLRLSYGFSNEFCAQNGGLVLCVEPMGIAPASMLIPEETSSVSFGIFKLKIQNISEQPIPISPEDFYCVTLSGRAVVIDAALYEKIKWPGKLENYQLLPQEGIERFVFFPSSRDYIRAIIHRTEPVVEVRLF
ncbi:MAG: hypothetical protein JRI45_04735 [Deltaproteobacteria bacterium]|nr:hypothetical protein [Deltaproteobacteria bacterium]MBW2068203.1 hypothetical protein [Deltaproteobacteria bacterium]